MAQTPAELCTLALTNIGAGTAIVSLEDDDTQEARVCRVQYDTSRRHLLSLRDWRFAVRVEALALSSYRKPSHAGKTPWDYAFSYPADCLRFIRIVPLDDWWDSETPPRFALVQDENGDRVVLTNHSEDTSVGVAWCEYVADVEDVTRFDDVFEDALSWMIASKIALPLTGRVELVETATQMYMSAAGLASAKTESEDKGAPNYPQGSAYSHRGSARITQSGSEGL